MVNRNIFILFLLKAVIIVCRCSDICERKLHNCTDLMQPVLREARYMFPTSEHEVEGMCKMWTHIMDCVRKYVTDCSSEEQRSKFNEAVSNSIDSVHAICSSELYRNDYLEYASCFRKVSIDHCGHHFKTMIDSAFNPHTLELHICCAYRQYEKCVSEPTQRQCGPQALHILDNSMASLKSRCDIVTQSLKSSGKACPVFDPSSNQLTPSLSPRPALRHVDQAYNPLTTSAYLVSRPSVFTTTTWTPRTVIYPLPVTRHSSRTSRSGSPLLTWSANCLVFALWMAFFVV